MPPFLSIVIPAFNEADRLPQSLPQVLAFAAGQAYRVEILVVDNGSTDGTAGIVRDLAPHPPNLRLLQEPRRGKGLAVRAGVLAAEGEYRFICDADLSMPIEQIHRFLPPALVGVDVAIGSREAPGAVRHREPTYRHWIGRVFNWLVRLLAVPGVEDTQCGFKCLRGSVAEDLCRVQRLGGWAFDVELLFIARKRGYSLVEVPIDWYYGPGSRVRPLEDSWGMLMDLFRIRRNWRLGLYQPRD